MIRTTNSSFKLKDWFIYLRKFWKKKKKKIKIKKKKKKIKIKKK